MRTINNVVLLGRLGRNPELRTSQGGMPWATLNLATGRVRRRDGGYVEETDWHRVKVFGADAERCCQYLAKGEQIAVEGKVTYESYQVDGQDRQTTVILADRVTFLGSPARAGTPAGATASTPEAPSEAASAV